MRKINIKEEFKADYISRDAGEKLRKMIEPCLEAQQTIELDFTGLMIASTSFLDEAFAKLHPRYEEHVLKQYLHIVNMTKPDARLLEVLIANRKKTHR